MNQTLIYPFNELSLSNGTREQDKTLKFHTGPQPVVLLTDHIALSLSPDKHFHSPRLIARGGLIKSLSSRARKPCLLNNNNNNNNINNNNDNIF